MTEQPEDKPLDPKEAMRQAVAESVPPKTVDVNMKAFDVGYEDGIKQMATIGTVDG